MLNPAGLRSTPTTADFIYVDANTGQSSGGHTGIRVGNKVYHYQFFPDDIFHLVRESYDDFAFGYNILSNRTSVLTRLDWDPKEISILESGLNRLYLVQFKHLQNWEVLRKEAKFFEELKSPEKKIGLRATAYFTKEQNSKITKDLKEELESKFGKQFLSTLENRLKENVLFPKNELTNLRFPPLPENISAIKFPFFTQGPYLKIRDTLEGILLCQILREEWGLNSDLLIGDSKNKLSEKEIELLQFFFRRQKESLLQIIEEQDPGWAFSALVALGRMQAVEESLESGFPVFLSSFPEDSPLIQKEASGDKEAVRHIEVETSSIVSLAREKISSLNSITEKEYQIWEDATNRAFELQEGLAKTIPVRMYSGKLIPQRENYFLISMFLPQNSKLEEYARISKERESEYHSRLKELYQFHLLSENCTTEIVKRVQETFDLKEKSFPGEKIDPKFSPSFIPFYASHSISKRWKNSGETVFLSYRRKKLGEVLEKEPGIRTAFRESLTFTSSIYKSNREDPVFPFFTDDVFWKRPLYGMVNFTAGLGLTTAGLFSLPFDKGERLQKGFQSAFFSLPEFIFFNIRKGTFPYVSMKELPKELFQFQEED
ncbi:hypothetical protein JWG45_09555 [Leptospira sp. 201903070]|uniref:Uncharacterized protein n=1 Tax=Leptospira ainlahdjerensis TaxID=2810033 RepID=A0ABS2UAK9_9LEPT|nr:hypothetical protein [Leptospira ainlahdjerensis]MBM9577398.1 hypothetical protein [Leptospira ainlahdjerensis]